jgi:hypothetical protein
VKAKAGEWIVIEGVHLDTPRRTGRIVEVLHPDGAPPYRVQWTDSDETTLVFPGSDARIEGDRPAEADSHLKGPAAPSS